MTSASDSAVLPWIAAADPGELALAYYLSPGTQGDPDSVRGPWFPAATRVTGADSLAPTLQHFVGNQTAKEGPICTQGSACSADRELGDYLGVHIAADGRIHVAWSDQERNAHWMLVEPT